MLWCVAAGMAWRSEGKLDNYILVSNYDSRFKDGMRWVKIDLWMLVMLPSFYVVESVVPFWQLTVHTESLPTEPFYAHSE